MPQATWATLQHTRKTHIRPSSLLVLLLAGTTVSLGGACSDNFVLAPVAGAIKIQTTSAGSDLDRDGYAVVVDQGQSATIGLNDNLVVENLALGNHTVALSDLATNCTAAANPQTTSVVGADTVIVAFEVTCDAVAPPNPGKN
jgi:hypothetical protein